MNRRLLLAFALVALLLAGCYETEVQVKLLPNGQALVIHTVSMPAAAFNMRLSAVGATPPLAENELAQLAEQDVALVGKQMELIDLSYQTTNDRVRLVRRYLFADREHAARFLDLLGLTFKIADSCSAVAATASADRLDLQKLTRLGRFFEKTDNGQQAEGKIKSTSSFTFRVTLPDYPDPGTPPGRKEGRTTSWMVNEENFDQPFKVAVSAKKKKIAPLPLGRSAPPAGAAIDAVLASLPTDGADDFTRRMGGRMIPIVHVRVGKDLRADLSLLWASDEISRDAADYFRRLEALLYPELNVNYYEWIEVLNFDDQRTVAEGYRTREPLSSKQLKKLGGAISISKKDGKENVAFDLPKLYQTKSPANGPADRVVAMLVVTFSDGQTVHAPVTVGGMGGVANFTAGAK